MDYDTEIEIWDSAIINIVNIKHGILNKEDFTDYFENNAFVYVLGDNGKIAFDGLSYTCDTNCLLHISPNKQVTIKSTKDRLEYFIVMYHAELSPQAGRRLLCEMARQGPFQKCYVIRTSEPLVFMEHFYNMMNEYSNLTKLSPLKIKQYFYSIVCSMYAELSSQKAAPPEYDPIDFIYEYLNKNYTKRVLINDIADSLGMARSTLHTQFRKKTGLSPQQLLMQLRLDAARKSLLSSRMSIDEVAASCGLRDKCYFTRVFKKKYGIAPGAYRKNRTQSAEDNIKISRCLPPQQDSAGEHLLIENMGRIHRYYEIPKRIVCLDYAAAEICAALGTANKITGIARAEEALDDCEGKYRSEIAKAPFLPAHSTELNVPSFRSVCDCMPDIVIGTSYSFNRYSGVADAEDFETRGIHIYAMKATYTLGCTYDSVYEDIQNLGRILGKETSAKKIVAEMKLKESALSEAVRKRDASVRVFSFDSSVSNKAVTCGQSIENHIIRSAGGINIFGDKEAQFVAVDWQEVRTANPQIILVHCFHSRQDGLKKIAFLKQIREIADTDAMRNNRIHLIGIKKVFPALDNINTARRLFELFGKIGKKIML